MKKIGKIVTSLALAVGLFASTGLIDSNHAFARGGGGSHSSFSGGSHSFSSSRSSSFGSSSSRSTSTKSSSSGSGWFGGSSKKSTSTSTSKPKVNLSKTSTSKKSSFSGAKSSKATKSTGSFSGAKSSKKATPTGRSYTGASRTVSYHGTSIHVSHYYHVGYSPFGWFSYYHGFTYGMFMGSMFHPWGGVYAPVGGRVTMYGASPIAWVLDIVILLIILTIIFSLIWSFRPSKTVYKRRF